MAEPIGIIFIFVAVVAIGAVLFAMWLFVSVLRVVGRGMGALFGGGMRPPPLPASSVCCPRSGCRAISPAGARYCRRCGQDLLPQMGRRRVAVW